MTLGRRFGDGVLLALGLTMGLVGCAHQKIPETNIDDTPENREILALVEEYHDAIESLDADAVLALVSPDFYEDNGNMDSSDDYGYAELESGLRSDFGRTKTMQLILRVENIEVDDDDAFAEVQYEVRAQNDFPSGLKWSTNNDRARLQLRRDDRGNWRIVSGL